MIRQEKYPNTKWFIYHNQNPKNRITGDCVIRAISKALNLNYNDVLKELCEIQIKTGYSIDENRTIEKFMNQHGWIKMKQERKIDNTKYTGKEFCEQIAKHNKNYVANIGGHHIVAICNKQIYDIWNCSNKTVGIYYVKKF